MAQNKTDPVMTTSELLAAAKKWLAKTQGGNGGLDPAMYKKVDEYRKGIAYLVEARAPVRSIRAFCVEYGGNFSMRVIKAYLLQEFRYPPAKPATATRAKRPTRGAARPSGAQAADASSKP